jgi:hypothetical protein
MTSGSSRRRHPMNRYRLYDLKAVMKLREKIMKGRTA